MCFTDCTVVPCARLMFGKRPAAFIQKEEEGLQVVVAPYRHRAATLPPVSSAPPYTDVLQTQPRTSHLFHRSTEAIGWGGPTLPLSLYIL